MTSVKIITAEEFKNRSFQIIQIPGFTPKDEPIHIQIRTTGIMALLANGRIPNTLLGKVTELFGEDTKVGSATDVTAGITDEVKKQALAKLSASDSGVKDMAELLRVFAEASMVQPTYAEVGEYLTDEQLMTIFGAMYGEVQEAESFRNVKGDD